MPEQTFNTIEEARTQVQTYKGAGYPYARIGRGAIPDSYKAYSGKKVFELANRSAGLGEIEEPEVRRGPPSLERFAAATEYAEKRELQRRETALAQQRAEIAEKALGREGAREKEAAGIFRLPHEEQEALYYGKLEAERARAEKEGVVAPRRRLMYGVPVSVPSRIYSDIQALEESRRNEFLQKQQEYTRIVRETSAKEQEYQKNQAMIGTYQANMEQELATPESKAALQREIEKLEIRNTFLGDDLPLLQERMAKLEEKTGGQFNPETGQTTFTKSYQPLTEAQKNAMIAASKGGQLLAGSMRASAKTIVHAAPYVGHVKGGLKTAARQTTGRGGQPRIAIAGLPSKSPGAIGMERPAIGTFSGRTASVTPDMSGGVQRLPTEGFASTPEENPLKSTPESEQDSFVKNVRNKLKDELYGTHL